MDRPLDASDHQLMVRCRGGDAAAFELLVRRWQQPLGRMIRRLRSSPGEVDDLCQEVFVRVLRACDRYRTDHSFSTWLYQIALNVVRDRRRSEARRRHEPLAADAASSDATSPEETLARNEAADLVDQALDALPEPLREVLVLKHFARLSFAEVAEATGVPLSTVKSRMQAALKQLRVELQRRGVTQWE